MRTLRAGVQRPPFDSDLRAGDDGDSRSSAGRSTMGPVSSKQVMTAPDPAGVRTDAS
jgi:hypothetical protein